jgi:hypothetical protein
MLLAMPLLLPVMPLLLPVMPLLLPVMPWAMPRPTLPLPWVMPLLLRPTLLRRLRPRLSNPIVTTTGY